MVSDYQHYNADIARAIYYSYIRPLLESLKDLIQIYKSVNGLDEFNWYLARNMLR